MTQQSDVGPRFLQIAPGSYYIIGESGIQLQTAPLNITITASPNALFIIVGAVAVVVIVVAALVFSVFRKR